MVICLAGSVSIPSSSGGFDYLIQGALMNLKTLHQWIIEIVSAGSLLIGAANTNKIAVNGDTRGRKLAYGKAVVSWGVP